MTMELKIVFSSLSELLETHALFSRTAEAIGFVGFEDVFLTTPYANAASTFWGWNRDDLAKVRVVIHQDQISYILPEMRRFSNV